MFTQREGIRKRFSIDGFTYIVEYRNRAVQLYIDLAESMSKYDMLPDDFGFFVDAVETGRASTQAENPRW